MKLFQRTFLILTIVSTSLFLSCSSSVDSFGDEILNIDTNNSTVILSNNSHQIVYYVLVESETANLIDLNPNVIEWPSIEAGTKVTIPYEEIMGYEDSSNDAWITWANVDSANSHTIKL